MQPSPTLLKELRTALASSKKKKKTVVSAGSRGTTLSGAPIDSQHTSSLIAGKRKANELVSSGGSTQLSNRRPGPGVGCAPLPAFSSVIFISGVRDTRAFLAWLRASCPGGLTAQFKSENLMVVPSIAFGYRAAVSALRSLDGREGVSFHTFTFQEDGCVRLLV